MVDLDQANGRTEEERAALAQAAADRPKLEELVEKLEEKRRKIIDAAEKRYRAELDKAKQLAERELHPAREQLKACKRAMAELKAHWVPRELVKAEADTKARVAMLRRELEAQRADIEATRRWVATSGGKPGEDLERRIAAAEDLAGRLASSLDEALEAHDRALEARNGALSKALDPTAGATDGQA